MVCCIWPLEYIMGGSFVGVFPCTAIDGIFPLYTLLTYLNLLDMLVWGY